MKRLREFDATPRPLLQKVGRSEGYGDVNTGRPRVRHEPAFYLRVNSDDRYVILDDHFHLSLRGATTLIGPSLEAVEALRKAAKGAILVLAENTDVIPQLPCDEGILLFAFTDDCSPLAFRPAPLGVRATVTLTAGVSPAKQLEMLRALMLGLGAAGLWVFNRGIDARRDRPFEFTRFASEDFPGLAMTLGEAMKHYQACAIRHKCIVQHSNVVFTSEEPIVGPTNATAGDLLRERFFFVPRAVAKDALGPLLTLQSDFVNPV